MNGLMSLIIFIYFIIGVYWTAFSYGVLVTWYGIMPFKNILYFHIFTILLWPVSYIHYRIKTYQQKVVVNKMCDDVKTTEEILKISRVKLKNE